MLKKGTPVSVPAPVIQGVVKAMKTVDDDHVEYLVGYMSGEEFFERWFTMEQLVVIKDAGKGIALTAAAISRSTAPIEKVLQFFDRSVSSFATLFSLPPEEVAPKLSSAVDPEVMERINELRDAQNKETEK